MNLEKEFDQASEVLFKDNRTGILIVDNGNGAWVSGNGDMHLVMEAFVKFVFDKVQKQGIEKEEIYNEFLKLIVAEMGWGEAKWK